MTERLPEATEQLLFGRTIKGMRVPSGPALPDASDAQPAPRRVIPRIAYRAGLTAWKHFGG